LEAMRAETPDDPFWSGVAATTVEPGGVRVRFETPREPRDIAVGRSVVHCHLHDPGAIAEAERIRSGKGEDA